MRHAEFVVQHPEMTEETLMIPLTYRQAWVTMINLGGDAPAGSLRQEARDALKAALHAHREKAGVREDTA